MLTIITEKRPPPVYYPLLDEVARVFKKFRPSSNEETKIDIQSDQSFGTTHSFIPPGPLANFENTPLAHCVPAKFQPIIQPPFTVSNFFCDVKISQNERQKSQLDRSVQCCPPPTAPILANAGTPNSIGAMVPFVYPPLPPIKRDLLMVLPDDIIQIPRIGEHMFPVIPPLPFPPTGYMPYPLIADNAPLTPSEIFSLWLVALSYAPRVDMVLASAAGSIFDIRAQAQRDGLTVQRLDRLTKLHTKDNDDYSEISAVSSDSDGPSDDALEEYMEFAEGVDTTDEFDHNHIPTRENVVPVESRTRIFYQQVAPVMSVRGNTVNATLRPPIEYSSRNLTDAPDFKAPPRIVPHSSNSSQDSKRKSKLQSYEEEIERVAHENLEDIYNTRKRQLLKKLELLQSSKIFFGDTEKNIQDPDLRLYMEKRLVQKDSELLQLKVQHTYDKLKVLMSFYQTSHRLYKTMNAVLVNKLKKLRNFLEFQQQVLEEASSERHAGEGDITNIKGRESAKLYSNFVEQDYSAEIKEVFRCSMLREEGEEVRNDTNLDPSEYLKVYNDREHEAIVDDYMPMVTENEFKLITGEAPSKTGVSKDVANKTKIARHMIFQNPLYDYGTSGSDTNLSENPMPVKRRPGRRAAPKPAYGEEGAKLLNDAALVAKIMKLFVGPAGANIDELTSDLGLIGIKTKWPLK